MTRFRVYDGFTDKRIPKAKYEYAECLIKEYSDKLKSGWSPFTDNEEVLYEDNLLKFRTKF